MTNTIKAMHFLSEEMRSCYAPYGEEPWEIGETRTRAGTIHLCGNGYHSSNSWRDAFTYVQGQFACKVLISPPVEKDRDKQVSASRTLVAAIDLFAAIDADPRSKPYAVTEQEKKRRGTAYLVPTLNERAEDILARLQQGKAVSSEELYDAANGAQRLADEMYSYFELIEEAASEQEDIEDEIDDPADRRWVRNLTHKEFNAFVEAAFKSGKYNVPAPKKAKATRS